MRIRNRILLAAVVAAAAILLVPAGASAVNRAESIQRGKQWVNYLSLDASGSVIATGVPYSQDRFAEATGTPVYDRYLGWRTDCSGFVSMCWDLRDGYGRPRSYDTRWFAYATDKFVQISKDQLIPGDMLLRSTALDAPSGGHAVLFAGWTDASKTAYWALEQTPPTAKLGIRPWGQPYFHPYRYLGIDDDFSDCEVRVLGNDRYSTAAAAVDVSWPSSPTTSVPALVVASGENWPDALGGSALAGAVHGPLLLTAQAKLPAATRAQIARLTPATVYVLGGTATVSAGVAGEIAAMGPRVVRLGGANRYDVSALVARVAVGESRKTTATVDTAYIATGRTFPDALAVSPISAKTGRPVLLTDTARLAPSAASAIRDLGIKHAIIVGGPASVSAGVARELSAMGVTVERIAGPNRYDTALAIANHGVGLGMGLGWNNVGIASGEVFPDALSGGCAQGQTGAPLLLTPGRALYGAVGAQLVAANPDTVRVYGGFITIPQRTRQTIAEVLRSTP
jgi:putative cell wall-binding protein